VRRAVTTRYHGTKGTNPQQKCSSGTGRGLRYGLRLSWQIVHAVRMDKEGLAEEQMNGRWMLTGTGWGRGPSNGSRVVSGWGLIGALDNGASQD
jgi:hypothetical protein